MSSDAQADDGFSLETQEQALRAYGQRLGAQKIVIIPDDISGQIPIRERPGGKELFKYIDAKTPGLAVGWYKVSRVSRDDDLVEMPLLLRDLRRIGAEFHLCDRGRIDLDDHFSKAVLLFESASAAKDNADRTEATKRGRHAKAKSGKIVGSGATPYCHDKVGERRTSDYVVNAERAAHIRRCVGWVLAGESLETCCGRLEDAGAVSPGVRLGRTSAGWYGTTIIKILRSPTLAGRIKYGDKTIVRDDLRVISDDEFTRLQAAIERLVRWDNPRNRKRDYLLTGRVSCSCGRRMVGQPGPGGIRYYRCSSTTARHIENCGARMVRADTDKGIEELAWREVVAFCTDPARLRAAVAEHNRLATEGKSPVANELRDALGEATQARQSVERLGATIGAAPVDAVAVLQAQLTKAAQVQARADARVAELQAAMGEPVRALDANALVRQMAKIAKKIRAAEGPGRLGYIRLLDAECEVIEGAPRQTRITFTGIVETASVVIDLPRLR